MSNIRIHCRSPLAALLVLAGILITGVAQAGEPEIRQPERSWPPYFLEHEKYFEPHTYRIGAAPVWSINNPENWAANSILIEGEDGLIVYDTGMSREHGAAILREIRKISDKPIVAIFYSHHHPPLTLREH